MKNLFASVLLAAALPVSMLAQSPVDIGMYRNGDQLDVYLRPAADFDGIVSSLVFTVRWDGSTGATLGGIQQEGAASQYLPTLRSGAVREVGSQRYQVYAGFGMTPIANAGARWEAGKEYLVASIPVNGKADFELANDAWTSEVKNNADYYLALGGADKTGNIYKQLASADEDGGVLVQPNPNNGLFAFSFTNRAAMDVTVEVVNSLGQAVFTEELKGFEGTYRKEMDLTTQSNGVYYLRLKRGEGTSTHKIVYK
ncbi:MAG: T9SS type A sorting domain-containing protein [Flavobacteriales bacterium]|jgi:hypothetical protein|nr:T9SS type A sorting domain-containing protein [Flavobacteriales bacterium]